MKILLFAGAGTSIELGVPGMAGMAEEFLDHAKQWNVEPDIVNRLLGETLDIERLIEELDHLCTAQPSLSRLNQTAVDLDGVRKIRAEVEWFVQHAAERVVTHDARLMWGSVLRAATSKSVDITLITTNYDRAIELASNAEQVLLDDGFKEFGSDEISKWIGFASGGELPRLAKLHGSTDWYEDRDTNSPIKLRHPMPLFGRCELTLGSGQALGSALVLPSREKLLTRDPYPRLSQAFLNACDECDLAIFVGSSLRDHHIRSAAETTAHRVPVFIVNPDGDTQGLEGVEPIRQCASTFLIGTLPNALAANSAIEVLKSAIGKDFKGTGILQSVGTALDTDQNSNTRCKAIEELDSLEVTLDPFLLRRLLDDTDAGVARYAFGLITLSAFQDSLIKVARNSRHVENRAFRDDLQVLESMVQTTDKQSCEFVTSAGERGRGHDSEECPSLLPAVPQSS